MPVVLTRVDDRLVHGQVVIGWGRPLAIDLILLVDEAVAASDWEQEIYRMAVPAGMEIRFAGAEEAAGLLPAWQASQSRVLVLAGSVETVRRLHEAVPGGLGPINLGGLHHRPGRRERLPYIYLSDAEVETLDALAAEGAAVTAQDLPGTTPVPLGRLR